MPEPTSSAEHPLVGRLIDLALFLPTGIAAQIRDDLPGLVRKGREQVQVARFFGEMAVTFGRNELIRRLEAAEVAAAVAVAETAPGADALAIVEVPRVPFDGYDTLPAAHVVQRLRRLDAGELSAVRAYEVATRNRRTIIAKVDQLLDAG